MQIEFTSRHGSVSDELRAHMTRKAEKLLTFFERVTAIQVTVDFENNRLTRVELLVDAEHKHDFVAVEEGEEVLATFDRVLQKMEQQVRKYKEKLQDHRRDRPTGELASPPPDDDADEG